ncbi:hypothetical protein L2E65_05685 [Planktothrix agardhii 1801]|uniref:hypothetical protein n=1 Tax=Planktothrix agardhii TaxID=1160 RepID=UPI001F1BF185|nr:hypothetical protein [Planktothrix agardhii]MCF3624282.1 hypothetical protein [Planktothrix agardhii 1801]
MENETALGAGGARPPSPSRHNQEVTTNKLIGFGELRITNYERVIGFGELRITNYERVIGFGELRITNYERVIGFG